MKELLIVGGGGIGERHLRCFLATARVSVSLCEANKRRGENLEKKYKIKKLFLDFDDVDLKDFEAVLIATPAPFHISMATRCAREGIPFLVEKPLSLNLNGVDRLKEIIHNKSVLAGVAFVRRSLSSFRELKELIKDGLIGEPRMGRFNASQDYPKYRPDYQKIYYAREDMGGGCILDAASHIINLAQWFFGQAENVVAFYDRLALKNVECEDSSIILLRFKENQVLADIFLNQFQKPNTFEIEIIGTRGNLKYDITGQFHRITFCGDDKNQWRELKKYRYTRDDPFVLQAGEFLDVLGGKGSLPTGIEEAKQTLRICLAAKESRKKGRILKI